MKDSIRNLVKAGIILSLLAFSNFLQASEEVRPADNIPQIELKHSHHKDRRHAHHHSPSVPLSVLISEELWRTSVIFLKDGLQLTAAGSTGNELQVVSQLIADNAIAINDFIYAQNLFESSSSSSSSFSSDNAINSDIAVELLEISFGLYAYVSAYLTQPEELPAIIAFLENANTALYEAMIEALSVRACDRQALRNALDQRLAGLKQLAQAFIAAQTGEYDDLFEIFNENLRFNQRVGRLIGNEIVGNS